MRFPCRSAWIGIALSVFCALHVSSAASDAGELQPLGLNLGGVNYFTTPFFANAIAQGGAWLEFDTDFGTPIPTFESAQFDANGCPRFLNTGKKLRLLLYGLHASYGNRPASWPTLDGLANGKIVVTWQGDADIRLNAGAFVSAESSGPATGRLVNGRRVYLQTQASERSWLTVEAINPANPPTDLKAWLPDPTNPQGLSLEGSLFHPTFLEKLAEVNWTFLRAMDWVVTNASPQQDWSDRRLPTHVFQAGLLNPRSPGGGSEGERETGVAFEHIVALCNAANKNLWINVPHLASDDFITRLAQLIRFGSDGVNPYPAEQADPVYPPLAPGLRVFVEYSNEIWSSGFSFPQGNWAEAEAALVGLSRARFNARRFCRTWQLFETIFGNDLRLVKVAAVFTGNSTYTEDFLGEIAAFGPTLSPAQEPDVIAPTTYFGNGIQDYAYTRAQGAAPTSDPWFLTDATFEVDGGNLRPVSVASDAPYWNGVRVQAHLDETFIEWKRRMLSGSTQTGAGPDATGVGGGFTDELHTLALTVFPTPKPLVSYEGGPSLYTDGRDGGDPRDDGLTTFIELVNRQPEMADLYRIHLNLGLAKGLRTHGAFFDAGGWGKFGQWGHLEHIAQSAASAPKWQFLLDWETEAGSLRPIDTPLAVAPSFTSDAKRPTAVWGHPYTTTVTTTGGDGQRVLEAIGSVLGDGLVAAPAPGASDRFQVNGTPSTPGTNFLFLRVHDADGDPAWRTFFFKTAGGPRVTLESNFEGVNLGASLPWTPTYVTQNGLTFSGWNKGAGIVVATGNDGLIYSQNMPAAEADATLAQAIADNEYWKLTLQGSLDQPLDLRKAEVRFSLLRVGFHAPRRFAWLTSLSGFSAADAIYLSPRIDDDAGEQEFVFTLPDTAAYAALTGAVEFRLLGFAGRFAGHPVAIRAFKITRAGTPLDTWLESRFTAAQQTDSLAVALTADPDADGLPNLLEYALAAANPNVAGDDLPHTQRSPANTLSFLFQRDPDRSDIILTVQAADSPAGPWENAATSSNGETLVAAPNYIVIETDTNDLRQVEVQDRYTMDDPAHPHRFMRLQVTKP